MDQRTGPNGSWTSSYFLYPRVAHDVGPSAVGMAEDGEQDSRPLVWQILAPHAGTNADYIYAILIVAL